MDILDLQIQQGETFSYYYTGRALTSGTNFVSGYLKAKYGEISPLVNLNVQIVNSGSGIFSLSIPATGTASLPTTIGFYDVEVLNGVIVTKIFGGKAYISPEVTY